MAVLWLDSPAAVAGALLNSKESVAAGCRDRTGDLGDDDVTPGFGVYVNVNPVA